MKRFMLIVACLVIAACGNRPETATMQTPAAARQEPTRPETAATQMPEATRRQPSPATITQPEIAATPTPAAATAPTIARYGVADFMQRTPPVWTVALVRGVVQASDDSSRRLTLIDEAEYRNCSTAECAELILPVSWPGPQPAPGTTVEIHGSIVDEGGRRLFAATRIVTSNGR